MKIIKNRVSVEHKCSLVSNEKIEENDSNLSVTTYVEKEDTRDKVDIVKLNKEIDEIVIYCKKTKATTHEDFLFNVRNLYKEIKDNGLYKKFNEDGQYGITIVRDNDYTYLVGCRIKYENTEKSIIPKGKYAVFNAGSREQKDIDETEINIIARLDSFYKLWNRARVIHRNVFWK